MHTDWDFDASNARTRRANALHKHQHWSGCALFCHNSQAWSKYAVNNLIHTQHKQTFCHLYVTNNTFCWVWNDISYYQIYNYLWNEWTNPMRCSRAGKYCTRCLKLRGVQLYKNNAHALLLRILSIINADWLLHASSVCGVYECVIMIAFYIITTHHSTLLVNNSQP